MQSLRESSDQATSEVLCKTFHTLLSSFVNASVASMNFLFLSWWRSSIWSNSASNFLCDTRHTGSTWIHKTQSHLWCIPQKHKRRMTADLSYLVYHQGLDLAFEDLHARSGNNWPHIWDYTLTEDLTDQSVVALETSSSWVFYGKTIVVIWGHKQKIFESLQLVGIIYFNTSRLCNKVLAREASAN